jgi:hypothetical protein
MVVDLDFSLWDSRVFTARKPPVVSRLAETLPMSLRLLRLRHNQFPMSCLPRSPLFVAVVNVALYVFASVVIGTGLVTWPLPLVVGTAVNVCYCTAVLWSDRVARASLIIAAPGAGADV